MSKPRGFAALTLEQRCAIASIGGKASHASGKAHRFTSDEARAAGAKGGAKVAADREHMAEIGRKGGLGRAAASDSSIAHRIVDPAECEP